MTQSTAKPRPFHHRWWVRLLAAIAAAIILLVLAVQSLLWTNLPRNIAIDILQRQLGLRISAQSLRVSLLGHTRLSDLSIGLPLSDEPFIKIDSIDVSHTSLLRLIATWSVSIDSVKIQSARIVARQSTDGTWNLQEAANLVAPPSGSSTTTPQSSTSSPALNLPDILLENTSIRIIDNQSHDLSIRPTSIHGHNVAPLVYAFSITVPHHVGIDGQVVTKWPWQHEAVIEIEDVQSWAKAWGAQLPKPLQMDAQWGGQLLTNGIAGRLTLGNLKVQDYTAQGAIRILSRGDMVTAEPRDLNIYTNQPDAPIVKILAGKLRAKGTAIGIEQLLVGIDEGRVQVDAMADLSSPSAHLTAQWHDVDLSGDSSQSGELTATLSTPWPNQPQIKLTLKSSGQLDDQPFETALHIDGSGTSWSDIDWKIELEKLLQQGTVPLNLRNVVAQVRQRGQEIFLNDITMPPPGKIDAHGYINLAQTFSEQPAAPAPTTTQPAASASTATPATTQATTQKASWYVWLDGANWQGSQNDNSATRLIINAWADRDKITLEQIYAAIGSLQFSAGGAYLFDNQAPLQLDAYLRNTPAPQADPHDIAIGGTLFASGHLTGTIKPAALNITGRVYGRDLSIMDRPIGDIDVAISGSATPHQGSLRSQQLDLLGGRWNLSADYWADPAGLKVQVSVADMNLALAGDLLQISDATGRFSGQWNLQMPQFDKNNLTLDGTFQALDMNLAGLSADAVLGKTTLNNGIFSLNTKLKNKESTAQVEVKTSLQDSQRLTVSLATQDWPLSAEGGDLSLSAHTDQLQVNLKNLGATGRLDASLSAQYQQQPLAKLTLKSEFMGRQVTLAPLGGNLLGGTISGQMSLDLDHPNSTRGQLQWQSIHTARLGEIWPQLQSLSGQFNGKLSIAPSDDPRALEPLRFDLKVAAEDGQFNKMQVGDVDTTVYLAFTPGSIPSLHRLVLDKSQFSIANGTINLWGRLSHRTGGLISSQLIVELSNLDMDQIVHALSPDSPEMPGLLSGQFTGVGGFNDLSRLYAQGNIRLDKSDLANFGPVAALYNAMHLSLGKQEPVGEGTIALRLDNGQLVLQKANYFNRGIQAIATGQVTDVFSGKDAGVNVTIAGSARPLKDVKLPLFADADQMFEAIQTSVTSIQVTGTIGQIKWALISFQQIGEGLREILFGEASGK